MKIMLTGASGFLGGLVRDLLNQNEQVKELWIISRNKLPIKGAKEKFLQLDLTQSKKFHLLPPNVDTIIHLAGLYDFSSTLDDYYQNNVLSTFNLLTWIKQNKIKNVNFHFASSYVVKFFEARPQYILDETQIKKLPPHQVGYAHTKAQAELAVIEAGLPGAILRLGILVGDEAAAKPKIDGPYPFVRLIQRVSRKTNKGKWLRKMPVLSHPEALLPLVPISYAAQVLADCVFQQFEGPEVLGVYNRQSVSVKEFADSIFERYMPYSKPWYIPNIAGSMLDRLPKKIGLEGQALRFSNKQIFYQNSNFILRFGDNFIPPFKEFSQSFFDTFEKNESLV